MVLKHQTRGQWPSANLLKVKADCNVVSRDETFEVFFLKKSSKSVKQVVQGFRGEDFSSNIFEKLKIN